MIGIIIIITVLLILGLSYEGGYLNRFLSMKYKKHVKQANMHHKANFAMLSPPFKAQPLTYALDNGISADPNCGGWAPCVGM